MDTATKILQQTFFAYKFLRSQLACNSRVLISNHLIVYHFSERSKYLSL